MAIEDPARGFKATTQLRKNFLILSTFFSNPFSLFANQGK